MNASRDLAKSICTSLGIKPRTKLAATGQFGVLDLCCLRAQQGELPYAVYTAAYGIAWVMQTGRQDGRMFITLRDMKARTMAELVAAVAMDCETINDVPGWLIANRQAILPA
jgi:hypothetical protein